jgi:parvulin-like peptidyl-prolyl isomerase
MPWLVNGELVDDATIREEQRNIRPRLMEAMDGEDPALIEARVKEWARENVIERVLLNQAAIADPEPIDPQLLEETLNRLKTETPGQTGCITLGSEEGIHREVEVRLRVDRLLERAAEKTPPPATKDIAEHYRKHREEFQLPETIHARHIVKNVGEGVEEADARAAIEQAVAALEAGRPFAEVADEMSDCPGRGGDLGWFPRGEMVDEFDEVVFAMEAGQTSGIFRSPFGFHVARVEAKKPAGLRPMDEVKGEISSRLHEEKKQKAVEQFLDRLWAKAKIEEQA